MRLWEQLKSFPIPERASPDLGLSLMMVPLVGQLVLEPYKLTLKEAEKTYLPDMKYFLSCENLRNFYLRNLRISRAQTDHIVRTLFYYSRMSGLWLEQGPPRRIVGRLFQHPPALLAAKMVKLLLDLDGKETPPWILELAEFDPSKRRDGRDHDRPRGRDDHRDRGDRGPEPRDRAQAHGPGDAEEGNAGEEAQHAQGDEMEQAPPRRREREEREPKVNRLPPPDQPMIWNGPLHAPVLRPTFNEEQTIRWARKNQTVRAYRPSGIPNQPTNHALLKSDLVYNYKPELEASGPRAPEEGGDHGDRGGRGRARGRDRDRDRGRGRGRGRDRGPDRGPERERSANEGPRPNDSAERAPAPECAASSEEGHQPSPPPVERSREPRPPRQRSYEDDDSIGNKRRPGEAHAALESLEGAPYDESDDDNLDDDVGNRLDAPPTSGHVGINGEGVLGPQGGRGGGRGGQHSRGGTHGRSGGPSGGGGSGSGGPDVRRRGRRRGRRGGGSGGAAGGPNRGASRSHPQ